MPKPYEGRVTSFPPIRESLFRDAACDELTSSRSQAIGAIAQLHAQLLEERREATGGLLYEAARGKSTCVNENSDIFDGNVSVFRSWRSRLPGFVPLISFSGRYLVVVVFLSTSTEPSRPA